MLGPAFEKQACSLRITVTAVVKSILGHISLSSNANGLFLQASEDLLREHYIDLKDRPFYSGLVQYMHSGPVVAMVSL